MAINKLTIGADLSGITRSFKKVFKEIETVSRKKISIDVDSKPIDRVSKSMLDQYTKLKQSNENAKKNYASLGKAFRDAMAGNASITEVNIKNMLRYQQIISHTRTELKKLERGGGSRFGGGFGGVGRSVGRSGGGGSGGGGSGGGSVSVSASVDQVGKAASMIPIAGWALGAPIGMYMGARALGAPRRAIAGQNLQLRGLRRQSIEAGELESIRESGSEFGIGSSEQLRGAIQLQRNVGDVDKSSMKKFAKMQKVTTGLSAEELSGFAGTFRRAAVGKEDAKLGQTLDKTEKMYKQAMISALDSSGAIKYMEVTANMTDQIANVGTADIQGIQDAITDLSLRSDFFNTNAERSKNIIGGFEGALQDEGLKGINMEIVRDIMKEMGIKNPSIFKMQNILDQGLNVKQEALGDKSLLDLKYNTRLTGKVAQRMGIKGGLEGIKPKTDDMEKLVNAVTRILGKKGEGGLVRKFINAIISPKKDTKTAKTDKEKDYKTMMEDKQKSIKESGDMGIKRSEAKFEETLIDLGDKIAPAMSDLEESALDAATSLFKLSESSPANTAYRQIMKHGDKANITEKNLSGYEALAKQSANDIPTLKKLSGTIKQRIENIEKSNTMNPQQKKDSLFHERKIFDLLMRMIQEGLKTKELDNINRGILLRGIT